MRFAIQAAAVGLVLAVWAAPAQAYGRGAVGFAGPRGSGQVSGRGYVGPNGAGRSRSATYVGPGGGASVQHRSAGGVAVGPYGGVAAGRASGTRVNGPGGNTFGHVQGGYGAVGPYGGVRAGGFQGSAFNRPGGGGAAVGSRGGVAVGPYGGVAGGVARGGVVAGGGGATRGIAGHRTAYYSPSVVRTAAVSVRATPYPYFTPAWSRGRAGYWAAPRWVPGYNLWRTPSWANVATFVGIPAEPLVYDYGSTVVIEEDQVYVNGDPVATAADYATQAIQVADAGRAAKPADTDEWQPLGVFGLVAEDEQVALRVFQLAVNKAGVIRGNYYDAVADNTLPVLGSLDKKSQRVAWSIGDKKDIVFETGLANLTQAESTVLIHYGKQSSQQLLLIRIEEPREGE